MKSVLISHYFPPRVGGISAFMASMVAALGRSRVCCLTDAPANGAPGDGGEGPRVYRRPNAFAASRRVQALGWASAVAEIMVRERPRAVQIATAYEGHLALWLRRWCGLPFVVYAHGNEILDVMGSASAWSKPRLALQQAARVLANSRFTASLVAQAGVPPERIAVVHPGCDTELFRPLPPDPALKRRLLGERSGDRVLLTVGNLAPRKGHDRVIRALPRLLRQCPDVTYLIVTSNSNAGYDRQLELLARSTGVRDRVVFAYDVPTADLPRFHAVSDVFVMPSRAHLEACDVEGFGLVYLEANACARAVVAGRSGGVADAVQDGVTGLLVDPLDPDAVADGLARLLSDPPLATRLGQQGRDRVVAEFTWDRVAARVQNVLETL
jgi:phosphatidylinositol alpha-1,6-mannosyltransferase